MLYYLFMLYALFYSIIVEAHYDMRLGSMLHSLY